MKLHRLAIIGFGAFGLAACATEDEMIAPAPPMGVGALVGTVAADRNGDGIVDGYYDANGMYTAFVAPPCPQPTYTPMMPSPAGERG